jgi:predicted dehydrogenase
MSSPLRVGIIGTGNIAPNYLKNTKPYSVLSITACADMNTERASAFAQENSLEALTVEAMLTSPDIDAVINLTIPGAHVEISRAALEAGKHVYSEKPLGIDRDGARDLLALADQRGLRIGCAPDTFLGGGLQTCRKLIDDGWIGQPVAASAFMGSSGPEKWHPNPYFFFQRGGGPMLDMGPYYLTALINLLGPVKRVSGSARNTHAERVAGHEALRGTRFPSEVNTHVNGVLEFESGPIANVVMSFDIAGHGRTPIEIYGTEGTLHVPDPNTFGGAVKVYRPGEKEWREFPLSHRADIGRGTGLADMAYAIHSGRPHRASGALAYHVLDIMLAVEEAAAQGQFITLTSQVLKPEALPLGPLPEVLAN